MVTGAGDLGRDEVPTSWGAIVLSFSDFSRSRGYKRCTPACTPHSPAFYLSDVFDTAYRDVFDREGKGLLIAELLAVEPLVNITQTLVGDVRVDLRRRNTAVAEELLDASQIGAAREQVRCIAVAQGMWRHALAQPGSAGVPGNHQLDRARR